MSIGTKTLISHLTLCVIVISLASVLSYALSSQYMREMKEEDKSAHLVIANLEIDMNAFTVKLNGKPIPCTPKETEILWTLASNPGMVFSREHLLQSIWGYDFLGDTRAVDSHIKRIRAKLCRSGNTWDIRTVWGVGYRFEVDEGPRT